VGLLHDEEVEVHPEIKIMRSSSEDFPAVHSSRPFSGFPGFPFFSPLCPWENSSRGAMMAVRYGYAPIAEDTSTTASILL